jgi:hypothetical protein
MRSEKWFLLILFLVLSACASNNNSTPTPSGSQNNAAASSSKRNVETIKSASGEACVIDEKRVCEEGTPGVMNDPYSIAGKDIRERVAAGDETGGEEFSGATLRYTLALLQGDREVILVCGVRRHTFKFGQLATGGTPTDIDIAKLRAGGYCSQ